MCEELSDEGICLDIEENEGSPIIDDLSKYGSSLYARKQMDKNNSERSKYMRNKKGNLTKKTKKILMYSGVAVGTIALAALIYTLTRKK